MKQMQIIDGSTLTKIPDFYQVKVWIKGYEDDYRYAIFEPEETKNYWEKRQLSFSHAIEAGCFRANADQIMIQPIGMGFKNEYDNFVENHFKTTMAKSKKLKGIRVGKLFSVPVGDGKAWYIISRVTKNSVKIDWRGYSGDRWVDDTFGYGGSFPKKCVERHVGWMDFNWKN